MREEKSGKRYFGFSELAEAYGIKPQKKRTKDKKKLEKQRETFLNRHICETCGEKMTQVSYNVMSCCNPKCKGIKKETTDNEGNTRVTYLPSFHLLDEKGADIAYNIFD